jgi:hypothetical protein
LVVAVRTLFAVRNSTVTDAPAAGFPPTVT